MDLTAVGVSAKAGWLFMIAMAPSLEAVSPKRDSGPWTMAGSTPR